MARAARKKRKKRAAAVQHFLKLSTQVFEADMDDDAANKVVDKRHLHKKKPRSKRRVFDHAGALRVIQEKYLGPHPEFNGKEFEEMFRLSRSRFQRLLEDFMGSGIRFYCSGRTEGASVEAKLLLPLKTLAFGVSTQTFRDSFNMSAEYARDCCFKFDKGFRDIYASEYLRKPTASDLKAIDALHLRKHGVRGMFGSLDCSHTVWKNCPKAWQGSFKGKEKKCTIVLEALCDYNLWFWHASYGHAGTANDKTILDVSSLFESFVDGSFSRVEEEAAVVPFMIEGEQFSSMFCLVDGIYPPYSRFVRGIKEPTSVSETKYTAWQEGARKDIERAFGVIQTSFKFMRNPIELHNPESISERVATCLMLHNMKMADRVHDGDCHATYNPSFDKGSDDRDALVEEEEEDDEDSSNEQAIALCDRWNELVNQNEHVRLHMALMSKYT